MGAGQNVPRPGDRPVLRTRAPIVALNSINTNVAALIALESLSEINSQLSVTQNRISTGLKVASAKDDPATWAIAQNERAQLSALDAVTSSLQRGQSIADTAMTAGQQISDLLSQMRAKALAATDASLTTADRQALSDDYVSLRHQIDTIASSASFDGVNLISAGSSGAVHALANADGTQTVDVAHLDLSTGGAAISGTLADLTGAVTSADLANFDSAIQKVNAGVAKLGTGSNALDNQLSFVGKLQDTLTTSIGNLVDADVAAESAKLQALQVKQQLAIKALSIANQAPSLLLSLFQSH